MRLQTKVIRCSEHNVLIGILISAPDDAVWGELWWFKPLSPFILISSTTSHAPILLKLWIYYLIAWAHPYCTRERHFRCLQNRRRLIFGNERQRALWARLAMPPNREHRLELVFLVTNRVKKLALASTSGSPQCPISLMRVKWTRGTNDDNGATLCHTLTAH